MLKDINGETNTSSASGKLSKLSKKFKDEDSDPIHEEVKNDH